MKVRKAPAHAGALSVSDSVQGLHLPQRQGPCDIRLPSGSIGVCQGLHEMFSDCADGGVMWTGEGDRERRHAITFDTAFHLPPVVHLSLTMWDTDHQTNARVDLLAESITEVGFHLVVRTWGDTRIARIRASWLAIGQVLTDDDWMVG